MFKNITLERPLVILDLETTGTNPEADRIVEFSLLKILPDGQPEHLTLRVNPGVPIPAEATAMHGITNADVADKPKFKVYASRVQNFLNGCDICGFNIKRFDLQILSAELSRARLTLPLKDRAIVDAVEIFHAYERRDLSAAIQFYCGRKHDDAHKAAGDVLATAEVLDAMVGRYSDLPRTIGGLHKHLLDPNAVDCAGRFVREEGQVRFTFGKHRGETLEAVARTDAGYLEWMLTSTFLDDAKALARDALTR
jgi:DNA polymerase-3 subunit epsilon